MDISPPGVTDEIPFGCHSDNFEDFVTQINAAIIEKPVLFNTVESMRTNFTHIMSILMLAW